MTNSLTTYFPLLLTAAPIILFFQQSKGVALKIFRIFWKQRVIPYEFKIPFYQKLLSKSINFNFDDYDMQSDIRYSSKYNEYLPIIFKLYKFELCLYRYIIPIFVFGGEGTIKIQYFKWTFNFEKFLNSIVKEKYLDSCSAAQLLKKMYDETGEGFMIEHKKGRSLKAQLISESSSKNNQSKPDGQLTQSSTNNKYPIIGASDIITLKFPRTLGSNIQDISWSSPVKSNNKYIFTQQGNLVLSQVRKWLKARKWYQEKDIRWYRGAALIGNPGTGKSALILEIAKELQLPIYIFDLQSFDNGEFEKSLSELKYGAGIILFEDIDAIFSGRENLSKSDEFGGLTFDFFINKLSGVDGIRNKFVFLTTNHIEKLDTALTRDGRIDEIIEIHSLNSEEKIKMASIILENNKDLINTVMENSDNLSTAEFENKCVRVALTNFWGS